MTLAAPEQVVATEPVASRHRRSLLDALWHNPSGRVGCILVGLVVLGALLGGFNATPYNPQFQNVLASLKPPTFSHFAGTDQFGRDEFSLVLQGLAVSLKIACLAVLIAGVVARWPGSWPATWAAGPRSSSCASQTCSSLYRPSCWRWPLLPPWGRLAEQRSRHRHRLHPDLRAGRSRPGPISSPSRLRAGRSRTRFFPVEAVIPAHPAEYRWHCGGTGQPGSRLGGPGRGQPQLPRAWPTAAHCVAR